MSGISSVEVWFDNASMCYKKNPPVDQTYICSYQIPINASQGTHTIKVTAYDNAGFSTDSYRSVSATPYYPFPSGYTCH